MSVLIIHWHCFQASYARARLEKEINLHLKNTSSVELIVEVALEQSVWIVFVMRLQRSPTDNWLHGTHGMTALQFLT